MFSDRTTKAQYYLPDELNTEADAITEVDFHWKVIIIYVLVIGAFCFLFLSVFQLQVVQGSQNYLVATRTSQSQTEQLAPGV